MTRLTDFLSTRRLSAIVSVLASLAIVVGVSQAATLSPRALQEAVMRHVEGVAADKGLVAHGETLSVETLPVARRAIDFPSVASADTLAITCESSLMQYFAPRTLIRARIQAPDGQVVEVGVPVKISLSKTVWVAKNRVMAGQRLAAQDFKAERRALTDSFDLAVGAEIPLETLASRLVLQPGQILQIGQIVNPPAVRQNEPVRVVVRGLPVKVALKGTAMSDGRIGDRVRVRQSLNRALFYTGVVKGDNLVEVNL
ncbi:MAG: flagellar basal body P-ring formation protein FlgA [Vampirovibrionales bacterium]|nr:flagellar basal body P-ring formation protein FlgA [Vampirovibrionales bacterium]